MITGKKIFLTGGAGFIGTTLSGKLVENNKIVIFDNLSRNSLPTCSFAEHPNIKLMQGDVTSLVDVSEAMMSTDPHFVIHLAAIAGIETVLQSPTTTMRVNLLGTLNTLEAARKLSNLERFVDFSTSEVFGNSAFRAGEGSQASIGAVGEARWIYAVSKLAGEHAAHAYYHEFGMPTVTLRPFNVYGPGQTGEGAIHTFVKRALADEELQIHGDGTQIRAWCYVDDMVQGVLLAMQHPSAVGESFNIGNIRAVTTIYGLANTVIRVLSSASKISFIRKDYADIELRVPNIDKARELIGFEAAVDLDEGLLRTAEFYRQ